MSTPLTSLPRISYEHLPRSLAELLAPRVERLGYLGEFFQCAAHQPDALGHFVRFTESLKAALPDELMEVVALTVSTVLGNDYERTQHEHLCVKLGFPADWVDAVERSSTGPVNLAEPLATTQRYVLAAVGNAEEAAERFAALCDALGFARAVAVAMATGRYVSHSLIVRSFGITAASVPPIVGGSIA